MKIVSWNLNGLIASMKNSALDPVLEMLPDIICLQEIRTQEEPKILNGYHHYWHHGERGGYSGTAVLCIDEPIKVIYGFLNDFKDGEGRLITLEYPDVYVVNAYVPNSQQNLKRQAYRMRWDEALREHIAELMDSKPVVLCGDFNVARDSIDIYEENMRQYWAEQGYASDERSNFETLLEVGLTDVFRTLHPDERSYTWWSNRLNKRQEDRGWRLDYFLISDELMNSVVSFSHMKDILGSDHCPIMLEVTV